MDRPETLVEAVAREIRNRIIRGDFAPQARLPEIAWTQELEVSRTTVREALRSLVDEGLVEVYPHRGAVVAGLTPELAREIYWIRAILESSAAREALAEGPPSTVALIPARQALERMQRAAAGNGSVDDLLAYGAADAAFHLAIASLCDNGLLLQMLTSLHARARRFVSLTNLADTDLVEGAANHHRILQAAEAGDPDRLAGLIESHIRGGADRLIERM